MGKFGSFLINESKVYLGHRVGDVLTSVQELQDDMQHMGSRHLVRTAEKIVNEIRKILHGQWEERHHKYLKDLQRVAVAIQRTIEDRGDLREVIPASAQALQDLSGKLGVRVNSLDAPEMQGEPVSQNDFEETGDGPQAEPNQVSG